MSYIESGNFLFPIFISIEIYNQIKNTSTIKLSLLLRSIIYFSMSLKIENVTQSLDYLVI
jgi:hypothetical protein